MNNVTVISMPTLPNVEQP